MKSIILFENWVEFKGEKYKNINDIKIGDRIIHYKIGKGTVVGIEDDGYTVKIKYDGNDDVNIYLSRILIDLIRKIDDNDIIKNDTNIDNFKKNINIKEDEEEIEEEEEEESEWEDIDDLTEEELSEMKIDEFFNDAELSFLVSLDDVKNHKEKLKSLIKSKFNPIKDKINSKRLFQIEILEKYFDHLKGIYPDKNIYKFSGQIPYDELWDIRKKYKIEDKIDDLDEYIKTGFIYYWIFEDSIVFKII